jgi:hypothetical protein
MFNETPIYISVYSAVPQCLIRFAKNKVRDYRFIAHLYTQLVTTSNCNATANSHSATHYSTHLSLFSLLCLHKSLRGNDFQRRTFPLLWVPELFPCPSYQLLTATAHKDKTAAVL